MEPNKLVHRLIELFLSTEIFSKRRKIYTWNEEKQEWPPKVEFLYLWGVLHSPYMGSNYYQRRRTWQEAVDFWIWFSTTLYLVNKIRFFC